MKTRLILIGLFIGCALILAVGAEYAGRTAIQTEWKVLRAEGPEDADTIDLTAEGDIAHKPATAKTILDIDSLSTTTRKIACIACAEANEVTFSVKYYGWAINGPCQRMGTIAYATGEQAVIKYPQTGATATSKYWADTAVVTAYRALPIEVSDGVNQDGVAEVTINIEGLKYLYAEVVDANGTAPEANNVTVYMREKN